MMPGGARSRPLDVLRAIAVTAVLVEHAPFESSDIGGWTGVDLFFVLSGFLVSGLLFAEQRAQGRIALTRFLVRRGFKIYPAFYALIAVTVAVRLWQSQAVPIVPLASELLFVQNYGPRLWMHTWSLAVEEHFYLLLSLGLVWLARSPGVDPFRRVPAFALAYAVAALAGRLITVLVWRPPFDSVMFATHLRLDALLCGTAIAYVFHYHRQWLDARLVAPRRRRLLVAMAAASLAPVLVTPPDSAFILTAGLTLSYVGYACVLLLALPSAAREDAASRSGLVVRFAAFVGRHSYSIYLWHVPILVWVMAPLLGHRTTPWQGGFWPAGPLFIAMAIAGGVVMARLIEMPMLAVREALVPRQRAAGHARDRG